MEEEEEEGCLEGIWQASTCRDDGRGGVVSGVCRWRWGGTQGVAAEFTYYLYEVQHRPSQVGPGPAPRPAIEAPAELLLSGALSIQRHR